MKIAIYVGSFDLLTNGHYWMIEKGVDLFDKLIVAVGTNPDKKPIFSVRERIETIQECFPTTTQCRAYWKKVEVISFSDEYTVKYCLLNDIQFILRGIRSEKDYESERMMRHVNEDISSNVTTIFLMPPRNLSEVSSSMVKGLIGFRGWQRVIERYVPQPIYKRVLEKYKDRL